jgi:hypothetical protein
MCKYTGAFIKSISSPNLIHYTQVKVIDKKHCGFYIAVSSKLSNRFTRFVNKQRKQGNEISRFRIDKRRKGQLRLPQEIEPWKKKSEGGFGSIIFRP